MLIIEVFMRNIVATLIYSDNSYTKYSIITKDYVVQFNDEGYASSPLLRVAFFFLPLIASFDATLIVRVHHPFACC